MKRLGAATSAVMAQYYNGPDHPSKMRIWQWLRAVQGHARLTLRYRQRGWITVDERDLIQRSILSTGQYEDEVIENLLSCAKESEVVWDVGANVGSFAVAAAVDPKIFEVHCFEPMPQTAALLALNLSLNNGRFQIHRLALSDSPGSLAMMPGPLANSGIAQVCEGRRLPAQAVMVACTTVDRLIHDEGLRAPTLLKLDVEGSECRVLRGATELLKGNPPKAIVFEGECNSDGSLNNPELEAIFASHGFGICHICRPNRVVDARENYLAVHRRV
jgi:FkbM family methyltransferase